MEGTFHWVVDGDEFTIVELLYPCEVAPDERLSRKRHHFFYINLFVFIHDRTSGSGVSRTSSVFRSGYIPDVPDVGVFLERLSAS